MQQKYDAKSIYFFIWLWEKTVMSTEAAVSSLKIYNVAGELVRSYEGMGSAGLNVITWDGKDNAGDEVASGIYFYKLTAGGFSATRKMVVIK